MVLPFAAGPVPDIYTHIPQEMRGRPQWVMFYTKPTGKTRPNGLPKLDKVPVCPVPNEDGTYRLASTTDPKTWGTLAQAMTALRRGRGTIKTANGKTFEVDFIGPGPVFSEDDEYVFIDLDNCIDVTTGEFAPWAWELVERFDSFTEISISGTGLHIFVKGTWPNGWNRHDGRIEVYDRARFCALGSQHLPGTPRTIEERGDQLAQLHAEYLPAKAAAPTGGIPRPGVPVSANDETLLAHIRRSKQGPKFDRLWRGDTRGYLSASEARWALIEILRFWTCDDEARIERLMWQSALPKDRWEERRGELTLLQYDIRRRCEAGGPVYEGQQGEPASLLADGPCGCDDDLDEVIESISTPTDGEPEIDPYDPAVLMAELVKTRAERDDYQRRWRSCAQQLEMANARLALADAWHTHPDKKLNGDDRRAGLQLCLEAVKNQGIIEARWRGADVPEPGITYAQMGAPINLSEDKIGDMMKVLTREDGGFLVRHERPVFSPAQAIPVDQETGEVREWLKPPPKAPYQIAYPTPPQEDDAPFDAVAVTRDLAARVRALRPNWEGTRKERDQERKKKDNELIAQEKAERAAAELRCPECDMAGTPASVTARLTGFCNHHQTVIADASALAQEPQQTPPVPVAPNPPPATPHRGFPAHNPVDTTPGIPRRRVRRQRQDPCTARQGIPRRGGRDLSTESLMGECHKCARPQPLAQQPRLCDVCAREDGEQRQVVNIYATKTCPQCTGEMPAHKVLCLRCAAGVPVGGA